ncbi:hypothetical protein Forpe1208_v002691 [Fusarium oxysporum f. sp. rapae]|uniref:Uncharacterized protein n=1 Tax=Fusarium oxysporum f. sp. rapae TaxID=485398 RepID=A0A8J5P1Q4_FUSOX|nr:hypothetical protein Forpe1208_v002691 [Fusarium oxysporum f. sp. rapae]
MTKGFLAVPNAETRLVVKVFIPKHLVSLDSMKAIASMLWLVDPLLSDIHPTHCGPNSLYSLGLQYTNLARDDANDLQAEMLSAVEVEDPWNIAFRLTGSHWSFYPIQEIWGKRSIAIGFTESWVLPPSKI